MISLYCIRYDSCGDLGEQRSRAKGSQREGPAPAARNGAEGKAGEASAATAAVTAATAAAADAAGATTAAAAAAAPATAVTAATATRSQSDHPKESGGGGGDDLAADTIETATQLFERTQGRGLIYQRLTFKFHLPFSKWQVSCTDPWVLCTNFYFKFSNLNYSLLFICD